MLARPRHSRLDFMARSALRSLLGLPLSILNTLAIKEGVGAWGFSSVGRRTQSNGEFKSGRQMIRTPDTLHAMTSKPVQASSEYSQNPRNKRSTSINASAPLAHTHLH